MKLGERGGVEATLAGEGPQRKRKPPNAAAIEKRVQKFCAGDCVSLTEGVPLNPGFFQLERMRAQSAVKSRAKVRAKVRGK